MKIGNLQPFLQSYRDPPVYQADPECYNGAVRENYSWSQSITDADIYLHVCKSRATFVSRKFEKLLFRDLFNIKYSEKKRGIRDCVC